MKKSSSSSFFFGSSWKPRWVHSAASSKASLSGRHLAGGRWLRQEAAGNCGEIYLFIYLFFESFQVCWLQTAEVTSSCSALIYLSASCSLSWSDSQSSKCGSLLSRRTGATAVGTLSQFDSCVTLLCSFLLRKMILEEFVCTCTLSGIQKWCLHWGDMNDIIFLSLCQSFKFTLLSHLSK